MRLPDKRTFEKREKREIRCDARTNRHSGSKLSLLEVVGKRHLLSVAQRRWLWVATQQIQLQLSAGQTHVQSTHTTKSNVVASLSMKTRPSASKSPCHISPCKRENSQINKKAPLKTATRPVKANHKNPNQSTIIPEICCITCPAWPSACGSSWKIAYDPAPHTISKQRDHDGPAHAPDEV